MNKITVSAPGKLMLLGEHAVVYDRPCLVIAVDQRIYLTAEKLDEEIFILDAPDVSILNYRKPLSDLGKGGIPNGAKFIEIALKNIAEKFKIRTGLKISTKSEFSSQFGFGSSSASTVCIVKALSELFDLKLSTQDIFDYSYKTILDIQGKGSGFDIAAAVFGGTLYFLTGGKVMESLSISEIPLVVGYSGIKADTVTLIDKVKKSFSEKQKELDNVYDNIEDLVNKAKGEILKRNWYKLGKLMNENQKYLAELGVSIEKLDNMINAANSVGAYGSKLSGAGGGDCIIAICSKEKIAVVENAIEKAGGIILKVRANAEGVRVEK